MVSVVFCLDTEFASGRLVVAFASLSGCVGRLLLLLAINLPVQKVLSCGLWRVEMKSKRRRDLSYRQIYLSIYGVVVIEVGRTGTEQSRAENT